VKKGSDRAQFEPGTLIARHVEKLLPAPDNARVEGYLRLAPSRAQDRVTHRVTATTESCYKLQAGGAAADSDADLFIREGTCSATSADARCLVDLSYKRSEESVNTTGG
jgi:hypothetical protein